MTHFHNQTILFYFLKEIHFNHGKLEKLTRNYEKTKRSEYLKVGAEKRFKAIMEKAAEAERGGGGGERIHGSGAHLRRWWAEPDWPRQRP